MAGQNKNMEEHNTRTLEKSLWQEYLTMPSIRELDCPDYKTYTVPLKDAGKGRSLEIMWDEYRGKKAVGSKKILEIENFATLERAAAFVNSTSLKSQMARLNRHVELGLRVAESDVDSKRNKLKALILKEEADLTHEYVDKAQKFAEDLLAQRKKKVDEIISKQETDREEQARIRREQQLKENSQDYRNYLSKTLKHETAEVQKHQICEKLLHKEQEEQFEKFWLDLAKKHDEERKTYEENEAIIQLKKLQEQKDVLDKQVICKKIMQEEMKKVKENENIFIDKLKQRIKEEEKKEKEFIYQQKLELKKMKLAQLEENEKLRMERAAEEKAFDDYYCKKVAEAIEYEKSTHRDMRAEHKRESDFFRLQLKEINAAKLEEERQIEALRQQEVEKKEAVIKRNQELMIEAKEKHNRETLEIWKQQIIHKKQILESEKEAEKLVDQWSQVMLSKNIELDQIFGNHQREEEVNLTKNLKSQVEYKDLLNKREAEENEYFLRKQQADQKFEDENWKSLKLCRNTVHPFTKLIFKK